MRGFTFIEIYKSTQVHALNPQPDSTGGGSGGAGGAKPNHHHQRHSEDNTRKNSFWSKPNKPKSVSVADPLLLYGLPKTDLIEPPIQPYLKPIDFVETLADLYRRFKSCSQLDKSALCVEQYSVSCTTGDRKLMRRCLRAARQYAADVHSKVVLSAWLRFERREDELEGTSAMDCIGRILECPKAALENGCDLNSVYDSCQCCRQNPLETSNLDISTEDKDECLISELDDSVCFCIGNEEINCIRHKIGDLSLPLNAMLYGSFLESNRDKINFSQIGISANGMRAVEVFSRTRKLGSLSLEIILELLSFSNRFCCEQMKSACDAYLSSLDNNIEDASILIEYGFEENASLLVASCLQIMLRELPNSLYNMKVMRIFCSSKARERLAMVGHASFLLYYFLSQVAMEESMVSNTTLMLLERLEECVTEKWQKALVLHQLGCVMLERKEYKEAQHCFEAAAEAGHVYSVAGLARTKYKQGEKYLAYRLMNSLISENKPVGWMYQEQSLYSFGRQRILDLNTATELNPTLSFPYKYRAVAMAEENQIGASISEINRVIGFKPSSDCLELRAWFYIALKDYESALRDIRALLTLDPGYIMVNGRISGDHLVELLCHRVQRWNQADCWVHLYDRWSSVDDVGSLAVIHQMLVNDHGNSLLRFRQSLLLLRLNCQNAALRSLRLARNHSGSEHEKLVYEGWILYDTGNREEALSKADKSLSIQRSFEAFFLKAYALADTNMDPESSSYAIQLLEEALSCPSDGLRKGQALNNLASIYVESGKLALAADCYMNAIDIKHTRAHQGLARVYHLKNQKTAAYDEMTKLIEKAKNTASAYEKRSEYSDREMANNDLNMSTQLDPLRTYPYRYRAAVLMDDQKETEAVEELTKAIAFKPDLQMLHLRAAFSESMGDLASALRDCEAALSIDPTHKDTLNLYNRTQNEATNQQYR